MSVKQLSLMCLVWPDDKPDEHGVEVEIDNDKTVAALREFIREKHPHRLYDVTARDLVLWKCSGLPDDNLEQTLKTIQFDGSDTRLVRLTEAQQRISQIFGDEDLSKEPIHILAEVPDRGGCQCPCCLMLKGLKLSQIRKRAMKLAHWRRICVRHVLIL